MKENHIVLRIDSKKLKALEKWAADELRSTNGQIEYHPRQRHCGKPEGLRETEKKDPEEEEDKDQLKELFSALSCSFL